MPDRPSLQSLGMKFLELRQERGLTLEQLSGKTGVSVGLLSQLERGLGNPSFETLLKISVGLNVPLASFFNGIDRASPLVIRKSERKRLAFPDRAISYELLTPDLNRDLEMLWIELEPGVETRDSPFSHQGEECGVVLQGVLETHINDECFVLTAGDSIAYQSALPHWYRNAGNETVVAIWVITPPSF